MNDYKIIGREKDSNCERCWHHPYPYRLIVLEFKKEQMKLCTKCFHNWRRENNLMTNSQVPAFNTLINAFDLLDDDDKMAKILENISKAERDILYNHPILKFYDLLP